MLKAEVAREERVGLLNLLCGPFDALHAYLVDGLVTCLEGFCIRITSLRKLNKNIFNINPLSYIVFQDCMSRSRGSTKEIDKNITII